MNMRLFACFCMIIQLTSTEAASIAEGKEFVISTPSMKLPYNKHAEYPIVVLTAMSSFKTTVQAVIRGTNETGDHTEKKLPLMPFIPLKAYYIGPDQNSGIRRTYHVTGEHPFVVMVSLETDPHVAETFTAVPVTGWGHHYIVTTIDKHFSVMLIAGESTNALKFKFKSPTVAFSLMLDEKEYKQGDEFTIELTSYHSYAIESCSQEGTGSLTGSSISGLLPFGVVTGNCYGSAFIKRCESRQGTTLEEENIGSTVAEMLIPVESLGQYFIMFSITGRKSPGYVIIVASQDYTGVVFVDVWSPEVQYLYLKTKGDHLIRGADTTTVYTTNPVYVTYVQSSSCLGTKDGEPSILMLIPVELFYFIYKCIVPNSKMKHFITVVVNVKFLESVQVLHLGTENPIIGLATGNPKDLTLSYFGTYNVFEYQVKGDSTFVLYSLKSRFGCYVHGVNANATYMHSAGFISSNINLDYCRNSEKIMKIGDLLDNDCDGKVDEEIENQKNDDRTWRIEQNKIDEDLGLYFNENEATNATEALPDMQSIRLITDIKVRITDAITATTAANAMSPASGATSGTTSGSDIETTPPECRNSVNYVIMAVIFVVVIVLPGFVFLVALKRKRTREQSSTSTDQNQLDPPKISSRSTLSYPSKSSSHKSVASPRNDSFV